MPPALSVKDGEYTKTIYTMIREQRFAEAINILVGVVESNPGSRAGLSLLGFCCYQAQDFLAAANCYEQLSSVFPEQEEYKLHWAQSLFQAGLLDDALRVSSQIKNSELQEKIMKLQAAIKLTQEDLPGVKSLLNQFPAQEPDSLVNIGCVYFKEGDYVSALKSFTAAMQMSGFEPQLLYNVALCHYKLKEYAPALKYIADIIERGIREHPELSVGMATEGLEVRSVGNTATLHSSALVEAFNLKAATEFQLKNFEGAREALTDMPPRAEAELDPVTLHNLALINTEENPTESFNKLQFLLQQQLAVQQEQETAGILACPPETFANLLLLYCKYEYYDMAADVLAEHADLTYKYLSNYMFDFLEALITEQTAPEEAYMKFDAMSAKYGENLRRAATQLTEAKRRQDPQAINSAAAIYEQAMELYMPVLMNQAKIYWDRFNYPQVEKLFRQSAELCGDIDVWRLNVAHTLFMQENKFREATSFYEPLVKKNYDNILNVSAVVLANLCVCYLLTSQNEEAEDLLRKLEKEEEQKSLENSNAKFFHLSIVNLVIGTLYCAKGNYEFGVSRVIKSLEPYHQKLGTDTWFYAKRCLLSLLENLSKHIIVVKDSIIDEVLLFLDQCQVYGRSVQTVLDAPLGSAFASNARFTVTYEARILKSLLLQIIRN